MDTPPVPELSPRLEATSLSSLPQVHVQLTAAGNSRLVTKSSLIIHVYETNKRSLTYSFIEIMNNLILLPTNLINNKFSN